MASTGTVQVVEEVDETESNSSSSSPPPLWSVADLARARASSNNDDLPPLESDGSEDQIPSLISSEGSEAEGSETDVAEEELPALVVGNSSDESEEESEELPDSSDADASDSDQPPALDDPEDLQGIPALLVGSGDDSDGELPENEAGFGMADHRWNEQQNRSKGGMKPGFLDSKQSKPSSGSRGYSNKGVGQREEGPSAAAARRKQERPAAPYAGAGAGARKDLRPPPQQQSRPNSMSTQQAPAEAFMQQQQRPQSSAAAAAAGPDPRWYTQTDRSKPKARAKPEAPREQQQQQQRPTEVVQDRSALEAFQRETEERRRARNMHRDEVIEKPPPVGRCCLNRGLHDRVEHCTQDKLTALVKPHEKRMVMRCSAGCVMLWHIPCWRIFQEGYEAETRELGNRHQGINITQALKVKDRQKPPVVGCVTPGCPGYINFLGSFEGPPGQETFKSMQYQPSQDNLAAIREAVAEDKRAAQAEKEVAAAARAAAALEAFRRKVNWKPRDPNKPRKLKPKPRRRQQQPAAAGAVAAAAPVGGPVVEQQQAAVGAAAAAAPAAGDQQHQKAGAAAAAEVPAGPPAAARPKGIQIKLAVKPVSLVRAAVPKEAAAVEETGPATPTAVAVEGSASQSASQSQTRRETTEQLQELGHPAAHVDATYHASVEDLLSQQQQRQQQEAEAAVGARRKGKKKGVTLHVDELQSLYAAQDLVQQQQDKHDRLSGIRPLRRQEPESQTLPAPQQQQQQQQQVAVPGAGEFPSLDQAALHDDQQLAETDYLAQALQELKIRSDDQHQTNFVLLECVDFYMMRKLAEDPEDVIRAVISNRTGGSVISMRLFEQQEAVAVMMTDTDANNVFVLCHRYQLHRKQLQPSFLRHFPFDDELHKACPQYMTPEMKAQQEKQEQQRVQLQQQQQAASEKPPDVRKRDDDPELQKLKEQAAKLTPLQLYERLQNLQRTPAAGAADGAGSSAAAARDSGAEAAGVVRTPQQAIEQQQLQQRQTSINQGQPPAAGIRPPAPPPGSPPKRQQQQQQQQTTRMIPPASHTFAAAPEMQYVQQQVVADYVPTFMQTPMGPVPGQLRPIYQTVMQPVVQQPVYAVSHTWPQQQQQGYGGGAGYAWQQQQHQFAQGYEQQCVSSDGVVGGAEDGDWDGEAWPEAGEDEEDAGPRQEGAEGASAEEAEGEEEGKLQQQASNRQQQLEGLLEGRARAASLSGTTCSSSGSPATKLNPLAKEFRIPSATSSTAAGTTAPSRLHVSSSAATPPPTHADDSNITTCASTSDAAASSDVAADSAMLATAHGDEATSPQATPMQDHSLLQQGACSAVESQVNIGLDESDTTAATNPSPTSVTAAPEGACTSSNRTSDSASANSISSNVSTPTRSPQRSSSSGVTPPSMDDMPANHIYDVVLLAGCNHQQLLTVYRNPGTPVFGLPHEHLPGSERVFTQETAGLILYNVENESVHGLWTAIANKDNIVHWKAVVEYADVPAQVYGPVISLAPFKQRYEAGEALAITKMLWTWKHPTPEARVMRNVPHPWEVSPLEPSSSRIATHDVVQQQTTLDAAPAPTSGPVTCPELTTSAPAEAAPASRRQLPSHIAMLANRPGSAGSGGHKVTLLPGRVCTICKAKPSGWLVMGCSHMGPCAECLIKPEEVTGKFYRNPVGYPVCLFEIDGHVCGKLVKELIRVVM